MTTKTAWIGFLASSPLGEIWAALSEGGLAAVEIGGAARRGAMGPGGEVEARLERQIRRLGFTEAVLAPEKARPALQQIGEYLHGERRAFDLPIDWSRMTSFQRQVLQLTCAIPYGQVTTYGELAGRLGRPGAARAVGRAQATNPMPLVIPCHRVLGSDGGLHGYGGGDGLETKRWLLELEGRR